MIYITQCPHKYEFNHQLTQECAGGAWRTDWLYHIDHPIISWIEKEIPLAVCQFVGSNTNILQTMPPKMSPYKMISGGGRGGFNYNNFKVVSAWAMVYNNNEGLAAHNHFPYTLSFIYMINSSPTPLILNDEEITTEENKLIIFPSHYNHNITAGQHERAVIAGNILYHD
tara:strand:+ start:1312 stop:1821 length:510 start_codon:yes stop_codon:yes gene_type:complete